MVFSSITFLFVFLPVTLLAYFLLPKGCRNYVVLAASLVFYAFGEPVYVILMLLSIGLNYVCGREMEKLDDPVKRKISLIFAVAADLSVLALFKYCTVLNLSLPVGISFYTFQALSYIIDLYRGNVSCEKSLLNFGLYICMFPQLIAGPIVRYADIHSQLENRTVTWTLFGSGVRRFITGLVKKAVIANGMGAVFETLTSQGDMSVLSSWIGMASYALQIYFDFSGYSDMAIGLGKMFGFDFNENFNFPYISRSITEFWRRWHISLSTWFREYVYIPLGGNRKGRNRQILNLLIVWTLTGIWHGANWTFMFWGFYYGVLLILEKFVWGKYIEKAHPALQHVYALVLINIGWVFFFSDDLGSALVYLGNLFGAGASCFADAAAGYAIFGHWLLWIIAIFASTAFCRKLIDKADRNKKMAVVVNIVYILVFVFAVSRLITDSYNPFLYFRF